MTRRDKLTVVVRRNPRAVRFEDACKAAESLGFVHSSSKGSHRVFKGKGERTQLNFQNRGGFIPAYQARQLISMIEKYGDEA